MSVVLPKPMPPRLPREITDLILDELCARPREEFLSTLVTCCVASKAFVKRCQKHIFHSVTLFSPTTETPRLPESAQGGRKTLANRSLLFIHAIAHEPHLRSYVREFKYAIEPSGLSDILPEVVEPLQQLLNLERLALCLSDNQHGVIGTSITDTLARCIASMFRYLPIKTFALSGIMSFRLDLHTLPTSLEQLCLMRSSLDPTHSASGRRQAHPDARANPSLKTLICDEQSLRGCINPYLHETGGQWHKSGAYSCLEKLDLNMLPLDPYYSATSHRLILGEVQCLKELTLTYAIDEDFTLSWSRDTSSLEGLNPSSFSSLTRLTFGTNLFVESTDDSAFPENYVAIDSPYMGLCNPPFSDLHKLQYLRVNITIQGNLNKVDERSFGQQWGELCDTLTAPGVFPKLSEVALAIDIRAPADSTAILDAHPMKRLIFDLVYPDRFQRLVELDHEGVLRFSFEVEVTEIDEEDKGEEDEAEWAYSTCEGNKKAVFIGINYIGSLSPLKGCHNDVLNLHAFITENYGYDEAEIRVLVDDGGDPDFQPTRKNIINALHWLVEGASQDDALFLHYSGHGGSQVDTDGDEVDGTNETICPVDVDTAGVIVDDDLHSIIVESLPKGCRLTVIFDACRSGSALDLPYTYDVDGEVEVKNNADHTQHALEQAMKAHSAGDMDALGLAAKTSKTRSHPADVVYLSGCADSQYSTDVTTEEGATGALSHAFVTTLTEDPEQSYHELLVNIRQIMVDRDYDQTPQLSSSHPMDMSLTFII